MAVTAMSYGPTLVKILRGQLGDLQSLTIKLTLHTASYTPNLDSHDFFNDATNELSTGGGYTQGGKTLQNKSVTYNSTLKKAILTADDIVWEALTGTFRYGILSLTRGGASSADELIGLIDYGANQSPNGIEFANRWSGSENGSGGIVLTLG